MSQQGPKRLRMFAGPNGSGKTSLVRMLAKDFSADGFFHLRHFINADDLYRELQERNSISLNFLANAPSAEQICASLTNGGRLHPQHPLLSALRFAGGELFVPSSAVDAYAAAAIADFVRDELFAASRSFEFETVMSHRSKTDFFDRARNAGYRTYLYFVATESSHLNVRRVENRAALGGHDVPKDKIAERYQRCLKLCREALAQAFRAFLFDNSGDEPVWLAELTPAGKLLLKIEVNLLPDWFKAWVAPHFPIKQLHKA